MTVREANDTDASFLVDSWLKSFKSSFFARKTTPWIYYHEHRKVVERLLDRCTVLVAADPQDSTIIWGWVCAELQDSAICVHYIYVKELLRGQRVATELMRIVMESEPEAAALIYTHENKATDFFRDFLLDEGIISEDLPIIHNPYLLFETESGRI